MTRRIMMGVAALLGIALAVVLVPAVVVVM
jgi:hypothetical protein